MNYIEPTLWTIYGIGFFVALGFVYTSIKDLHRREYGNLETNFQRTVIVGIFLGVLILSAILWPVILLFGLGHKMAARQSFKFWE